jgi:hypothetical protein
LQKTAVSCAHTKERHKEKKFRAGFGKNARAHTATLCARGSERGEDMMKTVGPRVMYLALIVFVICFVFWVVAFFFGYVADDWSHPAADERSFPAPKTY